MADRIQDLGVFTAYGEAREAGYEGSKAEFELGLKKSAEYTENAQASADAAAASADDAELSAAGAAESAEDAETSAGEATQSATDAAASAVAAAGSANAASASATQAASNAQAALGDIAPVFDATKTYNAGDYVIYTDGKLYRFTAAHAAGAWTGTDAEATVIGAAMATITEQTYNLVIGKIEGRTINSSGQRGSNSGTDLWAAPVEEGKTYTIKSPIPAGTMMVAGYFVSSPIETTAVTTYNNSRTLLNYSALYTVVAPITGYIGFVSSAGSTEVQIVEGSVDKPYLSPVTARDYVARGEINRLRGLSVICLKKPEESLTTPKNLSLIAGKIIQKEGDTPDCAGYLFLEESTQKLYYSSNTTDNPKYLCDWDKTLAGNEECKFWCATITADNDIVFLRDHARRNPIIYPHGNYSNPYVIDFGDDKKPYGWLMSGSVVQFTDGSFVFGDYAWHSLEDERNDDRRIIWRVEKPYAKANWVQAHSFKHVYPSSSQSDEPNNEIGHIHAIMYDFHADDLYCTTGDIDRHCRMWISNDHGETWAAVPGAVGTTEDTTVQAEGQKWRMTGSIFLKDYMYWATDSFYQYHNIWRCKRGENGHIDFTTLEKVCNLEIGIAGQQSQATYVTALVRNPYGLLIIDRAEPRTDGLLDIKFYDLNTDGLNVIGTFERATGALGNLDQENRGGLPNQFATLYQPQSMDCVPIGGSKYIRANNTTIFNNSLDNYVGGLKLKVT